MLRIATRRSPLARWQAEWVAQHLRELGHEVEMRLLTSQGDADRTPIDGSQAVGLFTKRIQQAVLEDEADIAVHSLKDLPTQIDTGMHLAAVPARGPVADCLVTRQRVDFDDLPTGARLGTGSRRRAAQLRARRPDLIIEGIRGNVDTRLSKLDEGFDGVVLAEAGLSRLEIRDRAIQPLPTEWMVPAAGQGALGIEVRQGDDAAAAIVGELDCPHTHACVAAERAVLRELRAGCLAPVGALATIDQGRFRLRAVVLSVDGQQRLEHVEEFAWIESDGAASERIHRGDEAGRRAAQALLDQGARPLVDASR